MQIEAIISKLRNRLIEYRASNGGGNGISLHVNAIDLAICLAEYGIEREREIRKEEEGWYEAGFYLDQIFMNSSWKDMIDLYYELVAEVKKRKFFRK